MYATDFIYDGINLSDFGCIICEFDSSGGVNEVASGVPLTIKTVARNKGNRWSIADTGYDSSLEITFDICKDPCVFEPDEMTFDDELYLNLVRWLVREDFLETVFIDDRQLVRRHYNGTFNVTKLTIADEICGLRVVFTTDKPYAFGDEISDSHRYASDGTWNFFDKSFIICTTKPKVKIKCRASGNLTISNSFTGSTVVIKGVTNGETIEMDGEAMTITSSLDAHDIWNDFNYEFLKVGNSYNNRINPISVNLACNMTISYQPIIRDAP